MVDGEKYASLDTNEGNIAIPENPQKEGMTFVGWYWDEGTWNQPLTINSILSAPVSSELIVYAYFVDESSSQTTTVRTYNTTTHPYYDTTWYNTYYYTTTRYPYQTATADDIDYTTTAYTTTACTTTAEYYYETIDVYDDSSTGYGPLHTFKS